MPKVGIPILTSVGKYLLPPVEYLLGVRTFTDSGGGDEVLDKLHLKVSIWPNRPEFVPDTSQHVVLFDLHVDATDAGKSFTLGSGPIFEAAVNALINGTKDYVVLTFDVGELAVEEFSFFEFTYVGWNGIDFHGCAISRIEFILESVDIASPGMNSNGDGIWTDYWVTYTLQIFGRPPIPAWLWPSLLPRLLRRRRTGRDSDHWLRVTERGRVVGVFRRRSSQK